MNAKQVQILTLQPAPYKGRATVSVVGISKDNYNDNRIFYHEGRRWVLQSGFGYDFTTGAGLYLAEQHDCTDPTVLWLAEFYTRNPETGEGGWDIHFAWVRASERRVEMEALLRGEVGKQFDEVITVEPQGRVSRLAGDFHISGPKKNLWLINLTQEDLRGGGL